MGSDNALCNFLKTTLSTLTMPKYYVPCCYVCTYSHRNPTSRSWIVGFFLRNVLAEYTPGMGQRNSWHPQIGWPNWLRCTKFDEKLAITSQNIWSPCPQNTRRYWGRAKAESFLHFSLPQNPTIRLLDVGFLCIYHSLRSKKTYTKCTQPDCPMQNQILL
jgi:hypothetical protein